MTAQPIYHFLTPESDISQMDFGEKAADFVIVCDADVSPSWRSEVCRLIILARPAYVICWGINCIVWHDEIDQKYIEASQKNIVPSEYYVMTTWHDDEPLAEAFWFAQNCIGKSSAAPTRIFHISNKSSKAHIMDIWAYAASAEFLAENP